MLFDWHIWIYDWAIWDTVGEASQYLQKKNSVCYQTNMYLNITYFYFHPNSFSGTMCIILIVNSLMWNLPVKYNHCWFNTIIQVIGHCFWSLFASIKYSLVAAECHYEFDCSIIVSFTWNCSIRTWMAWISCGIWRKIELKYSLKEKKISLEGKCWH